MDFKSSQMNQTHDNNFQKIQEEWKGVLLSFLF